MNTQMIYEAVAVVFAVSGILLGFYVGRQCYRGDLNLKWKANIFILFGCIEGFFLVPLALPLIPPGVKALIMDVTKSLTFAFIFAILVGLCWHILHCKRYEEERPKNYVLLTWIEYFVAIGVVFVLVLMLMLVTEGLSTVAGKLSWHYV